MGKLMTFMMGPVAELVDDVDAFFFSMFFTRFSPEFFEQRAASGYSCEALERTLTSWEMPR